MCVCLTSVHSKTSGHLFVFVCVRVCTPVLVYSAGCVSAPVFVSIWAFVSGCMLVCAQPHGCGPVCLHIPASQGHYVSLLCTWLSRALGTAGQSIWGSMGHCGLMVKGMYFGACRSPS